MRCCGRVERALRLAHLSPTGGGGGGGMSDCGGGIGANCTDPLIVGGRGLAPPPEPPDGAPLVAGPVVVTGLPSGPLRAILARRLGSCPPALAADHRTPCQCSLKSALVPASHLEWWRSLMPFSPFGSSFAKDRWPYLGAVCTSRRDAIRGDGQAFDDWLLREPRTGTWGKAFGKLGPRARAIVSTRGSAGRRAQLWSTYVASLAP